MQADPKPLKKRAVLLSDSVIETDPRVSKFAQTLVDGHWQVTTLGLCPPENSTGTCLWTSLHIHPVEPDSVPLEKPGVFSTFHSRLFALMASGIRPFSKTGAEVFSNAARTAKSGKSIWKQVQHYWWLGFGLRLLSKKYQQAFWKSDARYALFLEMADSQINAVDVWIANDWNMLPIALALRAKKGGKVLYDSHEFATQQFVGNTQWRWFKQPLVRAVERDCIRQVDAVSSVSPGLCAALQARYALSSKPVCIRNIPNQQNYEFRPSGTLITVLYQGVIGPGRALEEIIKSTPFWRDEFCLILRGPEGVPGYGDRLRRIVDATKPAIAIRIEPPVPFDEMITRAHDADIGILALPGGSVHNQFALPNKVFEYMMAGLALCVSNLDDMANLVRTYNIGTLIDGQSPLDIASAINAMDADVVNACKRASLRAIKSMNWEKESIRFKELLVTMVQNE